MEQKRFNINLDDSVFTKERTPLQPQFQPSSKGQNISAASPSASGPPPPPPAAVSVDHRSLSYAQYIVQGKNHVSSAPSCKPVRTEVTSVTHPAECGTLQDCQRETDAGVPEVETQVSDPDRKPEEHQRSEPSLSLGPKSVGSGSSIIVSPRQRGNPILKFVRSVPWEFGDVVPDYVLGQTTCALFLSLRYHNLNRNYIHDRLKLLGQTFTLRVLLVQVDVKDPHHALQELARICILADCTLILAWSPEEAGRYLETYKSYEKKPADLLKEQVDQDYLSKVTDCLTTVKSINKTDAMTLLSTFSSVEGIASASKEELVLCPGLGPQKARRLYDVLHKPFLKSKTKDS